MIRIDKLVDRLFATANESAALMAAGKMSAAADAALETSRLGGLVGKHPNVEEMSPAAQEKLAVVEIMGDDLAAVFRERGIVQ